MDPNYSIAGGGRTAENAEDSLRRRKRSLTGMLHDVGLNAPFSPLGTNYTIKLHKVPGLDNPVSSLRLVGVRGWDELKDAAQRCIGKDFLAYISAARFSIEEFYFLTAEQKNILAAESLTIGPE